MAERQGDNSGLEMNKSKLIKEALDVCQKARALAWKKCEEKILAIENPPVEVKK